MSAFLCGRACACGDLVSARMHIVAGFRRSNMHAGPMESLEFLREHAPRGHSSNGSWSS